MEKECVFCKIIKGEIPSYKIYEDEDTLAFLDISADVLGHTLVILKEHTKNFVETPMDKLILLTSTAQKIAKQYIEEVGFDGVQIVVNNGESAGQTIMHLHIHILPSIDEKNHRFDCVKSNDFEKVSSMLSV